MLRTLYEHLDKKDYDKLIEEAKTLIADPTLKEYQLDIYRLKAETEMATHQYEAAKRT